MQYCEKLLQFPFVYSAGSIVPRDRPLGRAIGISEVVLERFSIVIEDFLDGGYRVRIRTDAVSMPPSRTE
jgi:hypothetical protein